MHKSWREHKQHSQGKQKTLGNRGMLPDHEDGLWSPSSVSKATGQDPCPFHHLLYFSYCIPLSGEKAWSEIHNRPDNTRLAGNGFHEVRRERLSACIYKNCFDWWSSWSIWVLHIKADRARRKNEKYHFTDKEIIKEAGSLHPCSRIKETPVHTKSYTDSWPVIQ